MNDRDSDGEQPYPLYVLVAADPGSATDADLYTSISEWARRWAYAPWWELRACLTMRCVLFQMRMETLRRKGGKHRRRGAA